MGKVKADGYKGVSQATRRSEAKKRKQDYCTPITRFVRVGHSRNRQYHAILQEKKNRKKGQKGKIVSVKRCIIQDLVTSLRDHTGSLGPHEVFTGLLGQSASLSLLVIHAVSLVAVLVVVLHDAGGDVAGAVLLA